MTTSLPVKGRDDTVEGQHSEASRSNECIKVSKAENRMESAILFGDCKISQVKSIIQSRGRDYEYSLFL